MDRPPDDDATPPDEPGRAPRRGAERDPAPPDDDATPPDEPGRATRRDAERDLAPRDRTGRDGAAGEPDAPEVNTSAPLALNALAIIGSWGGPFVIAIGVVGLIFAFQATKAKRSDDVDAARMKARTSLTLGVVAIVLGLMSSGLSVLQKR